MSDIPTPENAAQLHELVLACQTLRTERDAAQAEVTQLKCETRGMYRYTCLWCDTRGKWVTSSAERDVQERAHAENCESGPVRKLAKVEAQMARWREQMLAMAERDNAVQRYLLDVRSRRLTIADMTTAAEKILDTDWIAEARTELAKLKASPAVHLPAQMGELRARVECLRSDVLAHWLDGVKISRATFIQRIQNILDLVPVPHDDAQGGKPVAP